MAKQLLEIEVPDGKTAVWKNGSVVFEDKDPMECIKTIDDAIKFLSDHKICEDILESLSRLTKNSYEWKIAAYRAVVAAITYDKKGNLTMGEYYYPSIEFCLPGNFMNCWGNTILGRIQSRGEDYNVVGGGAYRSSGRGLGEFDLALNRGESYRFLSFRAVNSEKVAKYISRQFGKLLFDISFGGVNCDWKWIE